jgi:hypothetical protein
MVDERTQYIRDQQDLEDLANEALDEACAYIQRKLGVKTGDFASHFFSDGVVVGLFQKYIDEEVYLNVLTKDQLIEKLIKDDIKTDFSQEFYDQILRTGFIGYQNQTLEELNNEWLQRLANR